MNPSQKLFTKYQLPLFFLLCYLLSWWAMLPLHGQLPHGPAIAAAIVIALAIGRTGLREWWGRLINLRAGWWFLIGPAILLGYKLVGLLIIAILGSKLVSPSSLPLVAILGELLLLGGQWEEPGWTGYALPTLQKRFAKHANGPLIATLIVGVFRGIWHIPLFLVGAIPWYDAFLYTAFPFQFIMSWIYNKSRGSVLAVMAFHFASNVFNFTMRPFIPETDRGMYTAIYMACGGLVGLFIAWKSKFRFGLDGSAHGANQ